MTTSLLPRSKSELCSYTHEKRCVSSDVPQHLQYSALHRAIDESRSTALRYLIRVNPNLDVRNSDGLTPLMRSCVMSNRRVAYWLFKELLQRGADVRLTDRYGVNILGMAVQLELPYYVTALLEVNNIDLHAKDIDGNSVFHYLAFKGLHLAMPILSYAARYHISVDVYNGSNITPLMEACRHGNVPVAMAFIRVANASVSVRDRGRDRTAGEWLQIYLKRKTCSTIDLYKPSSLLAYMDSLDCQAINDTFSNFSGNSVQKNCSPVQPDNIQHEKSATPTSWTQQLPQLYGIYQRQFSSSFRRHASCPVLKNNISIEDFELEYDASRNSSTKGRRAGSSMLLAHPDKNSKRGRSGRRSKLDRKDSFVNFGVENADFLTSSTTSFRPKDHGRRRPSIVV